MEDEPPPVEPTESSAHMSWWKRTWITLCVILAIAVTSSGVLLVRKVLDHSVDPQALLRQSSDRLTALDPSLAGLEATGADVVSAVVCVQGTCASAARQLHPTVGLVAATLVAEADSWASISGLGTAVGGDARPVQCGSLTYAPVNGPICELGAYAVPGQDNQKVHVYALLHASGKPTSFGVLPMTAAGKLLVGAVYVQVLTSPPQQ